jgi:hypothetical protein
MPKQKLPKGVKVDPKTGKPLGTFKRQALDPKTGKPIGEPFTVDPVTQAVKPGRAATKKKAPPTATRPKAKTRQRAKAQANVPVRKKTKTTPAAQVPKGVKTDAEGKPLGTFKRQALDPVTREPIGVPFTVDPVTQVVSPGIAKPSKADTMEAPANIAVSPKNTPMPWFAGGKKGDAGSPRLPWAGTSAGTSGLGKPSVPMAAEQQRPAAQAPGFQMAGESTAFTGSSPEHQAAIDGGPGSYAWEQWVMATNTHPVTGEPLEYRPPHWDYPPSSLDITHTDPITGEDITVDVGADRAKGTWAQDAILAGPNSVEWETYKAVYGESPKDYEPIEFYPEEPTEPEGPYRSGSQAGQKGSSGTTRCSSNSQSLPGGVNPTGAQPMPWRK